MFFRLTLLALVLTSCVTDHNLGLNPHIVQKSIVAQYPRIQKCYVASIKTDGHAGIVKAAFTIDKNGRAKAIQLIDESLGTEVLNPCLMAEIRSIQFPKPRGEIDVPVTYPFKFEADTQLTQAAVMNVLRKVNTSLCYAELAANNNLKVKLKIGKQGRIERSSLAFDETDLKSLSPCLARMLQKQKFPKIQSKQFQSVSVVVTFQVDASTDTKTQLSQTR